MRIGYWAELLFPDNDRVYSLAMVVAYLWLIPSGMLCLITGWGLERNRRWARWTGIAACGILIFGFPWFTALAAIGLYILIAKPAALEGAPSGAARRSKDYWSAKKKSLPQTILIGIAGIIGLSCFAWAGQLAQRLGMPPWATGWRLIPILLLFQFFNVAVHELGHAAMAWAQHNRMREIAVFPFVFSFSQHGNRIHFQWRRIFDQGGHVASVPLCAKDPRLNLLLTVAAVQRRLF